VSKCAALTYVHNNPSALELCTTFREVWSGEGPGGPEDRLETLTIYKLSLRKFTTQNDLYQEYESTGEVILIAKFLNCKCLQMKLVSLNRLTQS